MFSDQQAVTGIALLASGYAQLKSGIDCYHWIIVVYLAWFSSLTHLTTLTVLRQYFRENHHARSWRAVVMFITVVMLGAALLPTGDNQWFSGPFDPAASIPAICYFRRLTSTTYTERFELGRVSTLSMVISLFVLASGYLTRIIKLSERATIFSQTWLTEKPSGSLRNTQDSSLQRIEKHVPGLQKICWIAIYISLESLYVWCKALSDVYQSMIWEVCISHSGTRLLSLNLTLSRFYGLHLPLLGGREILSRRDFFPAFVGRLHGSLDRCSPSYC